MHRALWYAPALALATLLLPAFTSAESVIYPANAPTLYMYRYGGTSGTCDPVIGQIHADISYNVQATNVSTGASMCSTTIPKGTQIQFTFLPHVREEVYWFGTGYSWDSPYGVWTANAVASTDAGDYYNQGGYAESVSMSVNPPPQHLDNISGFSCSIPDSSGSVTCTASAIGSFTPTFTFDATYGYFYLGDSSPARTSSDAYFTGYDGTGWVFYCPTSDVYQHVVPQQSISCPITVVNPNGTPPTPPSISASGSGSSSCTVGSPYSITMSSTDSDGDQVKYGIDWNNNGTIDQFVPSSGYVNSGVTQTASRTYATTGTKTIKVIAVDSRGLTSGWATFTTTCADQPDNSNNNNNNASGNSNQGGGTSGNTSPSLLIRAAPSLVRPGDTTTVSWSASSVLGNTCIVTSPTDTLANGAGLWTGALSTGVPTSPIIQQTIYTLSCTGLDDSILTQSTTVNTIPVFQEL